MLSNAINIIFPHSICAFLCICVTMWYFLQNFTLFHYDYIYYGELWSVISGVTVVTGFLFSIFKLRYVPLFRHNAIITQLMDYVCVVIQLCLTLCSPMDCSPPGSSIQDSPGKNTAVCCLALLQGIFPTQGSNPGLPHCRGILYQLNHQETPWILEWRAIPSPGDLPDPGIELGSLALQVDSLPAEL